MRARCLRLIGRVFRDVNPPQSVPQVFHSHIINYNPAVFSAELFSDVVCIHVTATAAGPSVRTMRRAAPLPEEIRGGLAGAR